ncbi:DUF6265 family protein [Sphingomonas soli]|uniref:DUF6265 family protein n=1 Tax=Sphingomonas soli TaxID=266127 RepID=UPI0008378FA9|nr:DUF6265 family protein [Sphingomonas soli]
MGPIMALALLLAQDTPLGWLEGQWCTDADARGRVTCETWTAEKGLLIGVSERSVSEGPVQVLERMRISAEPGQLVFHADPVGQEGGDFHAMGAQPPQSVRFENPAHDYPQVIRYWREGDMLNAEISLADGSKARRWAYRRKPK